MALQERIFERARERSEKYEIFSNPLRLFIALVLFAKREATWSELKGDLEESVGSVNPNTLSFHIGRLMGTGFVDKVDIEGQPRYRINEGQMLEMEKMIGEDLIKEVRESLGQ